VIVKLFESNVRTAFIIFILMIEIIFVYETIYYIFKAYRNIEIFRKFDFYCRFLQKIGDGKKIVKVCFQLNF